MMKTLIAFFRWFGVFTGLLLVGIGIRSKPLWLKIPSLLLGGFVGLLGGLVDFWTWRPNKAWQNPRLPMESWDVIDDGLHNSNTDMTFWNEAFYLVHAASPYHLGSPECHLVVLRSEDAKNWKVMARLDTAPEDIRDPKFAVIGDQLFLYALKNVEVNPEPYTTVYTTSQDGADWEPFRNIQPEGWLFWRPKTRDGETWFVPAYWWEHGRSVLFQSSDGVNWQLVSEIYSGNRNDETDFEFLPDGRMISTARLEYSEGIFGHPDGATMITVADPPYENWQPLIESRLTRLDGPCLFSWNNQIYAVGRYQPDVRGPFEWQGSAFASKRTALFAVREDGLVRLTDLPSSGDTAYAGAVIKDDDLYVCYYTSDIEKDPVWILGMLEPSNIRMAKVSMFELESIRKEIGA
jgi:hypothetical protein